MKSEPDNQITPFNTEGTSLRHQNSAPSIENPSTHEKIKEMKVNDIGDVGNKKRHSSQEKSILTVISETKEQL